MKGCIWHFVKWQIHPFISRGTVYGRLLDKMCYLKFYIWQQINIWFVIKNLIDIFYFKSRGNLQCEVR